MLEFCFAVLAYMLILLALWVLVLCGIWFLCLVVSYGDHK